MKSEIYMQLMMMAAMMSGEFGGMGMASRDTKTIESMTEDEIKNLIEFHKERYKEILLKKGLKEFTIDGHTVCAINEKNAQRKVAKLLQSAK